MPKTPEVKAPASMQVIGRLKKETSGTIMFHEVDKFGEDTVDRMGQQYVRKGSEIGRAVPGWVLITVEEIEEPEFEEKPLALRKAEVAAAPALTAPPPSRLIPATGTKLR